MNLGPLSLLILGMLVALVLGVTLPPPIKCRPSSPGMTVGHWLFSGCPAKRRP
jgi:hypothetical protein